MTQPAKPEPQPTKSPTNKTVGATGGSALGAAIATIILYLIEQHSGPLPAVVSGAITIVTTSLVTFIAGYLTPHGANEVVMRDASGKVVSASMAA